MKLQKSSRCLTYQKMKETMDSFKEMELEDGIQNEEGSFEAGWKVLDDDNGRVYEINILGREKRDDE